MDEAKLIHKLKLLEALYAGAATEGEKVAAGLDKERILKLLEEAQEHDPPIEYRFSMNDSWSRKLLVALMRRYGIKPYRYKGQRYTTVMARVPKSFVDGTLWPQYEAYSGMLRDFLSEVTDRVIKEALDENSDEADVVEEPKLLG